MKYNIIQHITTSCNYDCSYCDVIKDGKNLDKDKINKLVFFIKNNYQLIDRFKFFGGEPLLRFNDIKYLIDNTEGFIGNKYEIVTNTTFLTDEIGEYFKKYFEIIFFSIDSENYFDYENVFDFINRYELKDKVYFNLIISPGFEKLAKNQFDYLYSKGLYNFNILPVYFTKKWSKANLIELSKTLKYIVDKSILDNNILLYGFQSNNGYNSSLINESLFIDTSLYVYHSDFVSTYSGYKVKNKLVLGEIDEYFSISNLDYVEKKYFLINYEKKLISNISGQKELHSIMDYFSTYLNKNKKKL